MMLFDALPLFDEAGSVRHMSALRSSSKFCFSCNATESIMDGSVRSGFATYISMFAGVCELYLADAEGN